MQTIQINKNSFVFRLSKKDFQLNIYTDGLIVDEISFVPMKYGYQIERKATQEPIFETDETIRRTKNNINNIVEDIKNKLIKKYENKRF